MFRMIDRMLLGKLKKAFTDNWTGRALGAALAFGAVAMPIVAIPGPANDAYAQSGQVATAPSGKAGEVANTFDARRELRKYSENPATRGIGVFINLQADAPDGYGDKIGNILKNAFAKRGILVDYRYNRSRGTATDITFYVHGVDYDVNVDDLKPKLPQILARHQGAWLPDRVSLNTQPQ